MKLRTTIAGALLALTWATGAFAFTSNVSIGDNFFSPRNDTILVGDAVRWTNNGFNNHTSNGTGFEVWASGTLGSGGTFTRFFNNVGQFTYRDNLSSATGTIYVIGATSTSNTSWGKLKQVYRKGNRVTNAKPRR